MVCPLGDDAESAAVVADSPVAPATALRERASVLLRAEILPLAYEYRRRANEETAKTYYHLFTEEEVELWYAYLTYTTDTQFASEIPDGAIARLAEALELGCFDGFIVRQRRATGEVMIIGHVETRQEVLYFPVTFWAPTAVAPVTAGELRTTLQEKRDREARRKAAQEERDIEQAKAAKIEKGKAAHMGRLVWVVSAVVFAAADLVLFWALGWGWGAFALIVTFVAVGLLNVWNENFVTRRDLRRYLVKPLSILCLIWMIGAGAVFAQFGTTSRVIIICGPGQDINVQTYEALDGTMYEISSDAEGQFYRGDPLNEWGYGRVKAEVERHLLFGRPVITSLEHTQDNDSEEVRALCEAPTV